MGGVWREVVSDTEQQQSHSRQLSQMLTTLENQWNIRISHVYNQIWFRMKHGHDRNHLNSELDTISDESARFHAWLTITIYLETILMNSSESTHLCFKMKWSWPTKMESLIDIEDFPGRSVRRSCLAPKSAHRQLMLKDFVTIQVKVQSPIPRD